MLNALFAPLSSGERHSFSRSRMRSSAPGAARAASSRLGGEAGLGKTRLASELARRANALDFEVLWGVCSEAELALPYLPLVESARKLHFASGPGPIGGGAWRDAPRARPAVPSARRRNRCRLSAIRRPARKTRLCSPPLAAIPANRLAAAALADLLSRRRPYERACEALVRWARAA
jgi:predicted ATPase